MRQTSWPRPFRGGTCSRLLSKYVELPYSARVTTREFIITELRSYAALIVARTTATPCRVCAIFGRILYPIYAAPTNARGARALEQGGKVYEAYNEKSLVHSRDCLKDCRIILVEQRERAVCILDESRWYRLWMWADARLFAREGSSFPWQVDQDASVNILLVIYQFFPAFASQFKLRRNEFRIHKCRNFQRTII